MALYGDLARLAEQLAAEGSRLKKRAAIAEALSVVLADPPAAATATDTEPPASAEEPNLRTPLPSVAASGSSTAVEAGRFCLYLAGQPFPEADARRLNAGGAILSRALKEISGATDAALTAAYRRHGDLGAGAHDLLAAPHGRAPAVATLTLDDVAAAFQAMAVARTTKARSDAVEDLLRRATALEAKYLLKLMLGDMRIGVKQSLIEEAIAVAACDAGHPTDVAAVRHAVMLEADLARAVQRAFAGTLLEARLTLFHPLGFMLASPVETPEEAIERFTAKPKKVIEPKPKAKRSRKRGVEPEAGPYAPEDFADLAAGLPEVLPVDAGAAGLAEDVLITAESDGGELTLGEEPPGLESSSEKDAAVHAFLEDKFDGIRAQLHCGDPAQPGRVAIYSRSREDITESFPELEEAFGRVLSEPGRLGGFILDGEILGWDVTADRALPFAILGQRIGRKRVDNEIRSSIPAVFMAFDLMCEEGELLLPLRLTERRARLEALAARLSVQAVSPLLKPIEAAHGQGTLRGLFETSQPVPPATGASSTATVASSPEVGGSDDSPSTNLATQTAIPRLRLSRAELVESAEAIDRGYTDARARANEGVMIKAAGSPYLPGRRGLLWVKLKRELGSLDVVITGAEFGSGRRSQVLSDYTFAVRGPAGADGTAELLNVGKAYSGVTDVEVAELTEWLKAHTLEDNGHFRTVEPLRVLEVTFNNIMRSDRHASGFALRFPRILRVRDDKPVEEIDTLARVEEIYQSQPDKPGESE